MKDLTGKTISHYRLIEEVGRGGMGIVYKSEDLTLRRTVALKFLPPTFLASDEDQRRFIHEAQASAALSHPNIATVFEIDEGGPEPFIAMEYIAGQTLAELVARGPLKMDEAQSIAVQISGGLQAAHEAGIVHRDIKCQNIMVTSRGQVKILDFGLAKLRGVSVVTKAGTTLGTVGYMSPEQLRGDPVDQRTDLWALGVVLYEMIAGRKPFHGDYEEAVAYQVLNGQQDPLTSIRTGVPVELERIVNKLLQKDPSARYQSATDLLVDLRSLALNPSSTGTRQISVVSPRVARLRRIIVVAAMILVVGLAGTYYLLSRANASTIRSLAVLPFENLSRDPDQEYFADELTDQLITELSKVHSIRVISRKSAMVFKNKQELLPAIGQMLNVEGLITATVLRSGDRVRINAQLIRASNEENLWSETFERKLEGILELQSTLARSITQRISVKLTGNEQASLATAPMVNPEAFDLVARANYLLLGATDSANFARAYLLMKKAVALDSNYADAQTGLALSIVQRKSMGLDVPRSMFGEAERAVRNALELNPRSGRAVYVKSQLAWVEGDLPGCIKGVKDAFDADSNDGLIASTYSWILMMEGNFGEGIRQAERSVVLDPLSQYAHCNLMGWYYTVHRDEDAMAQAHRILEIDSTWEGAVWQLAVLAERHGKIDEARRWWVLDFERRGLDSKYLAASANWEEFRKRRFELFERAGFPGDQAWVLLLQGEKERALPLIAECVEQNKTLTALLFYPEFDGLRDDPRFEAIVEKAKLPVSMYCTVPRSR